jgi:glyoxalase family protein
LIKTLGIHHITSIVNDPQRNLDFYAGVLGLRLIKKTVNYDRPEVYHLYFGNETGDPGTVITFFPWPKLPKGRIGTGQVGSTVYVIPVGASSFWEKRLQKFGIRYSKTHRFGEQFIQFQDPDGLEIELVERETGSFNTWSFGEVTTEFAIKGFGGAILIPAQPFKTVEVLEHVLGLQCLEQQDEFIRFQSKGELGNIIDIKLSPSVRGLAGAGTVHHIAWRVENNQVQNELRKELLKNEYYPTEILDRNYFKALYFHEPGGILFEVATDEPGFTVDEKESELGTTLMLPNWLEPKRAELEDQLQQVTVRQMEGE